MTANGVWPKIAGDIFGYLDANQIYYGGALSSSIIFGSVSVGTTATTILAVNSGRKGILIRNNSGTTSIYYGTTGVTTSTGKILSPYQAVYLVAKEAIVAITSSGTADVRYVEAD